MSVATTRAGTAAKAVGGSNPWIITILVAFASFMEVLDTTVANVALPYVAGGMGVSADEASWVVTTYLVSNAVILTASGFLARRFGRKAFFITCLILFTISSVLCGFAPNLETLLLFRILQGLGGGGMVPVSQSIVADSFPPEKVGQGFALWGIAVVVAPVVGPTLGGWISDNFAWQWCFLINGPVGVIAIVLSSFILRESDAAAEAHKRFVRQGNRFDLGGFVLVATFLGALEIVLDRGVIEDWFASSFIVAVSSVCALAFALMIPWELTRRAPMIDIRMVATRQFSASLLLMLSLGAILLSTTQFLPQLVQQNLGYTATWAGLVLSPGGLVTMVMMPIAGRLSASVQPRYLIAIGAAVCAASMFDMSRLTADVDFWFFATSRLFLNVGIPLIFIPVTVAAYDGIPHEKTDQASSLVNAARNIGGSIGISVANNVLARRQQFHQSRLVELFNPAVTQYTETLKHVSDYFVAMGSTVEQAQQQAIAWIGQQVQMQATFLSYIDVFWILMLIAAAGVPLALTLRRVKLGGAAPMGH
ncbi:MAG: DHA2 family efflux MFS transporter permease subunit [Xanthobacteraceae bacterium]